MLFIIDLDGTLANNNKEISKTSINIINRLCKNNKLLVSSYESYSNLYKLFNNKINCDYYSLTDCLGNINFKNKKIAKNFIEKIITNYNNYIYTMYSNDGFIYNYQERLNSLYPKNYNNNVVDVSSLFISLYNEVYSSFIDFITNNHLKYEILGKDSKKTFLKLTNMIVNKLELLNIYKELYKNEKIVVITDAYSDLDILNQADIKIVMKNGDDKIKEHADYITEYTNDNDGCMLMLDYIAKLK